MRVQLKSELDEKQSPCRVPERRTQPTCWFLIARDQLTQRPGKTQEIPTARTPSRHSALFLPAPLANQSSRQLDTVLRGFIPSSPELAPEFFSLPSNPLPFVSAVSRYST
ncbi:hypothetical protein DPEC_G00360350 [Dallia pectoralis]|uniref:Uncharacterized protein n=1 Tax=Dallia pectoralis TaxID=75939 RepID=A0ACC2F0W1_DALPE|nr:hypothetical protein DPEC_G00360350 [Dallia pectoralis]